MAEPRRWSDDRASVVAAASLKPVVVRVTQQGVVAVSSPNLFNRNQSIGIAEPVGGRSGGEIDEDGRRAATVGIAVIFGAVGPVPAVDRVVALRAAESVEIAAQTLQQIVTLAPVDEVAFVVAAQGVVEC